MPAEVAEKPSHFTYLKDFRTQQCPDFLQHKCSHHRPYNCFSWHFVNQKRRRPVKKKDGTFNYSPDIYCHRYDETTGVCHFGDECPLLHRVAGDVERRYHPRYYKTCMCVHETDSKGHCVKNGPHCAYAHGPDDLRMPIFDANEDCTANLELSCNLLAAHLEKDIQYNEDPNWNDPHYVLVNYKTEQCHRPHRLCRQGYACPSYHNPRDKRRSPKVYKYRSTPCPNVKRGDEWGDPPLCDAGDSCSYCHTRTEQQFHPEIYKSSKCNDMVQSGYCPRGQFCAFAHLEKELNEPWDALIGSEASLSEFVEAALPSSSASSKTHDKKLTQEPHGDQNGLRKSSLTIEPQSSAVMMPDEMMASSLSRPELVGKRRTVSLSEGSNNFTRSLGTLHERQLLQLKNVYETKLDSTKESFPNFYFPNLSSSMQEKSILSPRNSTSSTHYPAEDTVESVIVNALEEDLGFSGLNLPPYDKDESDSLCGSLGASYPSFGPYFATGMSRAVAIPPSLNNSNSNNMNQQGKEVSGSFGSQVDVFGRSCPLPPIGSEHAAHMLQSKNHQASSGSGGDMGLGNYQNIISPQMMYPGGSHPLSPGVSHLMMNRNELDMMLRMKLASYEDNLHSWKQLYGELKKETEDLKARNKLLEEEKNMISLQRDDAVSRMKILNHELSSCKKKSTTEQTTSLEVAVESDEFDDLLKQRERVICELKVIDQKLTSRLCSLCQKQSPGLSQMSCNRCLVCPTCCSSDPKNLKCAKCNKET